MQRVCGPVLKLFFAVLYVSLTLGHTRCYKTAVIKRCPLYVGRPLRLILSVLFLSF